MSPKFNGLRLVLFTNLDKILKNVKHRVFKLMISLIADVGKEKNKGFLMKRTHKLFGLGLVLVALSMNAIAQNQSTPMQHMQHMQQGPMSMPVSYTHLTLPTIYSV